MKLFLDESRQHIIIGAHFTPRKKERQLNEEGSQKAASSVGQGEEVQGDPSDVARGQLERYEGTCQRGSDGRNV